MHLLKAVEHNYICLLYFAKINIFFKVESRIVEYFISSTLWFTLGATVPKEVVYLPPQWLTIFSLTKV